jgi:hypothetical protein
MFLVIAILVVIFLLSSTRGENRQAARRQAQLMHRATVLARPDAFSEATREHVARDIKREEFHARFPLWAFLLVVFMGMVVLKIVTDTLVALFH